MLSSFVPNPCGACFVEGSVGTLDEVMGIKGEQNGIWVEMVERRPWVLKFLKILAVRTCVRGNPEASA
jgi:hypothetical protein